MGALTNCSSERRIEITEEANIIMKMKTCKTVCIIPVRWSFSKVTFLMFWLQINTGKTAALPLPDASSIVCGPHHLSRFAASNDPTESTLKWK